MIRLPTKEFFLAPKTGEGFFESAMIGGEAKKLSIRDGLAALIVNIAMIKMIL